MPQVKNRYTGEVICEGETVKDAVVDAVVNGVNLNGANLNGANLSGANLINSDLSEADLSDSDLSRANLSGANLSGAYLSDSDLSGADLSGANLSGANLSGANLSGSDLSGANLGGATMPGFNGEPKSLAEAIQKTREWLLAGHWAQGKWINTPDGAYAGTCTACVHGAAVYIGGKFGPELSRQLTLAGYDISFNDAPGRTVEEIASALDEVAKAVI